MARFLSALALRLPIYVAALWWGSLTALGAVVVPVLFASLPTRALAGQTAASLFSAQSWLGSVCGVVLLLLAARRSGSEAAPTSNPATAWILGGTLLALLLEFAIAPRIVARDNLPLWHGVGSAVYWLQGLCAGATLWRSAARQD